MPAIFPGGNGGAGTQGPPGPQGPAGPTGPPGVPSGDTIQSSWNWRVEAVEAPLDSGDMGVTEPPPREARKLIASCIDAAGADLASIIEGLRPGDYIYLQVLTNPTSWHRYEVTKKPVAAGDYTYEIDVTTNSGSPPETAPTEPVEVITAFQFSSAGTSGDQLWHGSGPPSDTTAPAAQAGDDYIDVETGDLYQLS